jgi:hypothetical protein
MTLADLAKWKRVLETLSSAVQWQLDNRAAPQPTNAQAAAAAKPKIRRRKKT